MYDITILQIYNYFFKSFSSIDEIGVHLNLQWSKIFLTSKAIFEFRVPYKGGSKMNPLLDPLKTNRTKWTPLMNHKEA